MRIETARPDGSTKRRRIWIVVSDGQVYVRSVRGERGYWYQSALERPDQVTLYAGKRPMPERAIAVRPIPAVDGESIERCSRGLGEKYARDPALPTMLREFTLETTLRLVPR